MLSSHIVGPAPVIAIRIANKFVAFSIMQEILIEFLVDILFKEYHFK